eukprot:3405382-Alexandrium_andersonii.AAC.1
MCDVAGCVMYDNCAVEGRGAGKLSELGFGEGGPGGAACLPGLCWREGDFEVVVVKCVGDEWG